MDFLYRLTTFGFAGFSDATSAMCQSVALTNYGNINLINAPFKKKNFGTGEVWKTLNYIFYINVSVLKKKITNETIFDHVTTFIPDIRDMYLNVTKHIWPKY